MKKPRQAIQADRDPYTSEQNKIGLERLMFFSDAVFAIAITILILDIRLPSGVGTADSNQLLSMLLSLSNKYLGYFISFWVIGIYWMNHHRKFLIVRRFDYMLLSLNLLLLMVIAFIPFPTSVVSENASRTATIFYASVMALGGLALTVLWLYIMRKNNLLDARLSKQKRWREALGSLTIAVIFIASIGVAYLNENLVRLFWLLIIPASIVINARRPAI